MKKLKKENKGFSLVELIVVVLILGILAVAVTPQIMDWVDKSKKNTDSTTVESIEVAAQAAVLDYMEEKAVVDETIKLEFDSTGKLKDPDDGANAGLAAMVVKAVGDVSAPKSGSTYYEVKITGSSGQVKVSLK